MEIKTKPKTQICGITFHNSHICYSDPACTIFNISSYDYILHEKIVTSLLFIYSAADSVFPGKTRPDFKTARPQMFPSEVELSKNI